MAISTQLGLPPPAVALAYNRISSDFSSAVYGVLATERSNEQNVI